VKDCSGNFIETITSYNKTCGNIVLSLSLSYELASERKCEHSNRLRWALLLLRHFSDILISFRRYPNHRNPLQTVSLNESANRINDETTILNTRRFKTPRAAFTGCGILVSDLFLFRSTSGQINDRQSALQLVSRNAYPLWIDHFASFTARTLRNAATDVFVISWLIA